MHWQHVINSLAMASGFRGGNISGWLGMGRQIDIVLHILVFHHNSLNVTYGRHNNSLSEP